MIPQPAKAGQTLFLLGRAPGLTRRRLERLVEARGHRIVRRPSGRVTMIVIGSSATASVRPDGRVLLPAGLPADAGMISEGNLRHLVGLLPRPEETGRTLEAADLLRASKLAPPMLAALQLFDVVEPIGQRFSYRDLMAAREAGRLIASGVPLSRIIEAHQALRRRGSHIGEVKLTEGEAGELLRDVAGQVTELSGQFAMPLEATRSVDELLAAAEMAEEAGAFTQAENLYATALRADAVDPVIPFNLGNIFHAQNRPAEAKVAWQIAIARDPQFAEAWYNLALAAEDDGQTDLALASYRRTIEAQPDFSDGLYNLAWLLTRLDRSAEALPHWERLLELRIPADQARAARKAAQLCRIAIHADQERAG